MHKADIRKLYLEKRRSLTSAAVEELSRRIHDKFFESTDLSGVSVLHTFIPIERFHEVDTSMIVKTIWRDHPRITTATSISGPDPTELEHAEVGPATKYNVSKFGIKEPAGERRVEPAEIDLVVVPLLAIDRRGFRVGYGKGLYDRFLAKCRPDCVTVGVSLFPPIDAIDDVAAHDVPLDRCITPDETISFQN